VTWPPRGFGWIGALGIAGTPSDLLAHWTADLASIVKEPDTRERILAQASMPANLSGAEFGAFLRQQNDLWGKVVRTSCTRLD